MSTPTRSAVPVSCTDALALLLQHHPEDQALELVQTRVQNKPLALHPTATTTTTTTTAAGDGRAGGDARDRRRQERQAKQARPRRKPRPLTAREKRALNVHALPAKSQLAYATFVPLHTLWLSYANSLVALGGGAAAMAGRLASGDLHGAVVEVVRSRAVDRVGIRGIVVKETRATLVVVTQADEAKTVPKEYTVFRVSVPAAAAATTVKDGDNSCSRQRGEMVFELQGSHMMFRAAERAGKKYKAKPMLDL